MRTIGFVGLDMALRDTSDALVAHIAFRSFAEASGASVWALAEVRSCEGGGFLFDVLASSRTGDGERPATIGPCTDDGLLEAMWRAREPLELKPASAIGPVAEEVLAMLGDAGDAALRIFPVGTVDPSRRLLGIAPGGHGVDLSSLHLGFEVYVDFFARLRRTANPPKRDDLTSIELDVLKLCAEGVKTKVIADSFDITAQTVRKHLERARIKLEARNLAHAVAIAMRARLFR